MLSGTLKFNVKISSDDIDDDSEVGVWTLNVHSCLVKENDWITPYASVKNVVYDVREPLDLSVVFETFLYEGPTLDFCVSPELTITGSDGIDIDFISAIFASG